MDFFQRIGNFFSQCGTGASDEEKRRKEQQAQLRISQQLLLSRILS